MKRLLNIVLPLLLAAVATAQDLQILSQQDLLGTARYVSLAGAMTAVGGDPSAVKDNPAALGIYRRAEVTLTFDEILDRVHQKETPKEVKTNNTFNITQAAFVFSLRDRSRVSGLLANNLMISYHRLASFNRTYAAGYNNDLFSLADVIALKTNGLNESELQQPTRWDNNEIGWLSCQGYDTYLIDPDPSYPKHWMPVLETGDLVSTYIRVKESGYVNQFSLTWGANWNDRIYWGVGLNILSLYHSQEVQYDEAFRDSCGLYNDTYVSHKGVGFNASFGVLFHPVRFLRIGASFTTPSATSITKSHYGDLSSYLPLADSLGVVKMRQSISYTSWPRYTDRSMVLPLRVSAGIAFQLKNYGLLSLQYDYAHQKNIYDTHTMRVGLEGVIVNHFFLSAGYALTGTKVGLYNLTHKLQLVPLPQYLAYNDTRTDAYSQFVNYSHNFSAGFGYRSHYFMINVAYHLRLQQFDTYAHELATPYDLRGLTHNIVLTLGFHTKR